MKRNKKAKVGSFFDAFLAEQGILEACEEQAVKQILADQIKAAMEKDRLTKAAMAIRGCKTDCVIAGSPTDLENPWQLKRK
jgi:phosphotransacetylase